MIGAPDDIVGRLALLCTTYGRDDSASFVDVVLARARNTVGTVQRMADAGDPGFVRLIAGGHLARMARDAEWIAANAADWSRALA